VRVGDQRCPNQQAHNGLDTAPTPAVRKVSDGVKRPPNEQNRLAPRRKYAESKKKTKQLFIPNHGVSASLRELGFFTPSQPFRIASGEAAGRWFVIRA